MVTSGKAKEDATTGSPADFEPLSSSPRYELEEREEEDEAEDAKVIKNAHRSRWLTEKGKQEEEASEPAAAREAIH